MGKELIRITCQSLIDEDKLYNKNRPQQKRNRMKELERGIKFYQSQLGHFHSRDVFIKRPIYDKKTKSCCWDGNECSAFFHIVLLVLDLIDTIDPLLFKIWYA